MYVCMYVCVQLFAAEDAAMETESSHDAAFDLHVNATIGVRGF